MYFTWKFFILAWCWHASRHTTDLDEPMDLTQLYIQYRFGLLSIADLVRHVDGFIDSDAVEVDVALDLSLCGSASGSDFERLVLPFVDLRTLSKETIADLIREAVATADRDDGRKLLEGLVWLMNGTGLVSYEDALGQLYALLDQVYDLVPKGPARTKEIRTVCRQWLDDAPRPDAVSGSERA